jgi:hypothetical protein
MKIEISRSGLQCLDLFIESAVKLSGRPANYDGFNIVVDAEPSAWMKEIVDKASKLLRNDVPEKFRIEVPASSNEKNIFNKLKTNIGLKSQSTFFDVFDKYIKKFADDSEDIVDQMKWFSGTSNRNTRVYTIPSIFKPEIYEVVKRPFYFGRGVLDVEIPFHLMILALSGYVASRVERVKVGNDYYTAFLFTPLGERSTAEQRRHLELLTNARKEGIPGLHPEEGLIMWLAAKIAGLAEGENEQLTLMVMSDPGGSNPAKLESLRRYSLGREIRSIGFMDEETRGKFEDLLKKSLNEVAKAKTGRSWEASYILKKLYLALSSESALDDLLYFAGRKLIESRTAKNRDRFDNIYFLAVSVSKSLRKRIG